MFAIDARAAGGRRRSARATSGRTCSARRSSSASSPWTRRSAPPATRARRSSSCCCLGRRDARARPDAHRRLGAGARARRRRCGDRDDLHARRRVRSSGSPSSGGAAWCGSDVPTARALATVLRIGLPTAMTGVVFSLIYVMRHAHGDAVRHAGARGARHRPPRGELAVHDRRRLRRGDGGDRRAEPRRGTRRSRGARGMDLGRLLLGVRRARVRRGARDARALRGDVQPAIRR